MRFFRNKINLGIAKAKTIQNQKLADMGISNDLKIVNSDKTVFNFSKVSLSSRLKTLLTFGLDFSLPISKLNFFNYFLKFKELYNSLSRDSVIAIDPCLEFKIRLESIANKYFYNSIAFKFFYAILT